MLAEFGTDLIKEQYAGVLDECARDCNALLLATRQLDTTLSKLQVIHIDFIYC